MKSSKIKMYYMYYYRMGRHSWNQYPYLYVRTPPSWPKLHREGEPGHVPKHGDPMRFKLTTNCEVLVSLISGFNRTRVYV